MSKDLRLAFFGAPSPKCVPEEARRAVREQISHGADLIKVYADWLYPTLTVAEMQVIVEEAHRAGRYQA